MHHGNVVYRKLDDKHACSPIQFSVRHMDHAPELQTLLSTVYAIYDDLGIAHQKETLQVAA